MNHTNKITSRECVEHTKIQCHIKEEKGNDFTSFYFLVINCARVQVRGGQLWGTDIYTVDSDLVAGTQFCMNFVF